MIDEPEYKCSYKNQPKMSLINIETTIILEWKYRWKRFRMCIVCISLSCHLSVLERLSTTLFINAIVVGCQVVLFLVLTHFAQLFLGVWWSVTSSIFVVYFPFFSFVFHYLIIVSHYCLKFFLVFSISLHNFHKIFLLIFLFIFLNIILFINLVIIFIFIIILVIMLFLLNLYLWSMLWVIRVDILLFDSGTIIIIKILFIVLIIDTLIIKVLIIIILIIVILSIII